MNRWFMARTLGFAILTLCADIAVAQHLGGQRFRPAASEDGVLGLDGATRRSSDTPFAALWLNYAANPIVFVNGGRERSLFAHVLGADLVASMPVWRDLEVGLSVPLTLYQDGNADLAHALGVIRAEGAAFGDFIVRAGYRFELSPRDALAVHVPMLLPTADAANLLALGWGVQPTVAYSRDLGAADLTVNASYLMRDAVNAPDYRGGSELGLGIGTRVALTSSRDTAFLAAVTSSTSTRDFLGRSVTPVEGRVGLEHWLDPHWRLTGFVATSASRGVGAPDLRLGAGIAYGDKHAQRRRSKNDRDGDGIKNRHDACPDSPEDMDGFKDKDGCPDRDNDRDGIPDEDDECPDKAETKNGYADDDGCPDELSIEDGKLVAFAPIRFETNKATIKRESYPVLRGIADLMKEEPDLELQVTGHADAKGAEHYNLDLSKRRAASVRKFLIGAGIAAKRLSSQGHGEAKPIASNETQVGRKKNRRVEFHVR